MTIEVRCPRIGVLTIADARVIFGVRLATMRRFGALVLSREGGAPFVGDVRLARKKSGRGEHLALECPKCRGARSSLHVADGALRCARCAKTRTRHQRERTLTSWTEHGGRTQDRVIRLLSARSTTTSLAKAEELSRELLEGDANLLAGVVNRVRDTLSYADGELERARNAEENAMVALCEERVLMGPLFWM